MKTNFYTKSGISKARSITYRSFGDASMDSVFVMLGGGPGISSKYMDPLASSFSSASKQKVLVLDYPDHETYNRNSFLGEKSFHSMTEYLAEALSSLAEDGVRSLSLLAHSYGASQVISLLARFPLLDIKMNKTVLLAPVFQGNLSKAYLDASAELVAKGFKDFKTEDDFRAYWGQLLPLYFANTPDPLLIEELLAGTTWLGNKAFAESDMKYVDLVNSSKTEVFVVSAGKDKLVKEEQTIELSRDLGPRATSIEGAGHFFMIENPEASADHIFRHVFDPSRAY